MVVLTASFSLSNPQLQKSSLLCKSSETKKSLSSTSHEKSPNNLLQNNLLTSSRLSGSALTSTSGTQKPILEPKNNSKRLEGSLTPHKSFSPLTGLGNKAALQNNLLSTGSSLKSQRDLVTAAVSDKKGLSCHQCLKSLEIRSKLKLLSPNASLLRTTESAIPKQTVSNTTLSVSPQSALTSKTVVVKDATHFDTKEPELDEYVSAPVQINTSEEPISESGKPIFPPLDETGDVTESPVQKLDLIKKKLINTVSGALISAPNFTNPSDAAVVNITRQLDQVADSQDPEFVLKLALYSRLQLNLRTVSNYLLAYSAHKPSCRPYLKRYFKKSVILPTDWIEVAELYQSFVEERKATKHGMVSAALRKVLIEKFPDFDEYQLGKYNKQKRTKKVTTKKVKGKVIKVMQTSNSGKKKKFTLKQLIRMTHITKPVNYVMSILGKKYPETPEEFNKLQMTGVFDSDKAGKRMRLAIPETWETQVSARGNKAEVWQELLDHNKLPFMAMLRNLRNLIRAGISEQHHKKVVRKLIDEKTIIRSKQFPFRFFSAFVALDDLIKELEKEEKEKDSPVKKPVIKKKATKSTKKKVYFTKKPKLILYNRNQIAAYKKALGRSVKIATMYNVNPIPNKTLIFCNVSDCMYKPCTSARAFGQPKQMIEVGVLLGLMCQHACESSAFHIFHENGSEQIQLSKDNILERTQRVLKLAAKASGRPVADEGSDAPTVVFQDRGRTKFPEAILWDLIKKQQKIDNLVILTREDEDNESQFKLVDNFLNKYRRFVNPNLLFVNVDLSGASAKVKLDSVEDDEEESLFSHPNDISIAGFSEQLLQFIAERGNNAQLQHVSAIDKAYQLDKVKVHLPDPPKSTGLQEEFQNEITSAAPAILPGPQVADSEKESGFRRVRVFISSTFQDMQMERELIVESLMPLLRKKFTSKLRVILEEIDLRWGVVAPENSSSLAVCLEHVQKCDLFVGLIGHRLGFCPSEYDVPLLPQFDWLRELELESPCRKSITQLEFKQAKLLQKPVFVFLRDRRPEKDDVLEGSVDEKQILFRESLSQELGNEVLCRYREGDQTSFGEMFEESLSEYIEEQYGSVGEPIVLVEGPDKANEKQRLILSSKLMSFTGRTQLLKDTMRTVLKLGRSNNPKIGVQTNPENDTSEARGALLLIKGDTGIGKSAFMASLVARLNGQTAANSGAFFHFSEPCDTPHSILSRILEYLKRRFNLQDMDIPVQFQGLVKALPKWLSVCASVNLTAMASRDKEPIGYTTSQVSLPLLFFLDGLDNLSIGSGENKLSAAASNLDWVPKHLPKGCVVVLSVSNSASSFLKRAEELADDVISVGELNMVERRHVVQKKLDSFGKHLDSTAFNNQLGLLVAKREAASPLYLSYACDELRMSGRYEQLTAKIKALPQTVSALMDSIVKTMEVKYDVNFVSAALLSLLLSPAGLRTSDLYHILSVYHSLNLDLSRHNVVDLGRCFSQQTSTLSYMWFSKLVTYLKLILGKMGEEETTADRKQLDLLQIRSRKLFDIVMSRYLTKMDKGAKRVNFNKLLAAFHIFRVTCADEGFIDESLRNKWLIVDDAPYSLILHHLQQCGDVRLLTQLVLDLNFVKLCFVTNNHYKLIQSLSSIDVETSASRAAKKEVEKFLADARVVAMRNFITANLHILKRLPQLIYQQASFSPELKQNGIVDELLLNYASASSEDSSEKCSFHSFQWINKPLSGTNKVFTVKDSTVPIVSVDVCNGTNVLAVGVKDCRVILYNTETSKVLTELSGFLAPVSVVKFVHAKKLIVGTDSGHVEMYSTQDWHKITSWKKHERKVVSVTCDPSGMSYASVGWDCSLHLWNVSDGKWEGEVESVSPCAINCVDWHPRRPILAIACWDSTVKLINTTSKTAEYVFRGHRDSVRAVVFTRPDGLRLVSASLDGDIRLWSVDKKCALAVVDSVPGVTITQLCLARDNNLLIGTSSDGHLRVWRSDLGREVAALDVKYKSTEIDSMAVEPYKNNNKNSQDVFAVRSISFSEDQSMFAILLANGTVSVACASSYRMINSCKFPDNSKAIVQFIGWAENNLLIVSERRIFVAYCTASKTSKSQPTWPFHSEVEFKVDKIGVKEKKRDARQQDKVDFECYSSEKYTCMQLGVVSVKSQSHRVMSVGTEYGNVEMFKVDAFQNRQIGSGSGGAPIVLERLFSLESAHEGAITQVAFLNHVMVTAGKDRKLTLWDTSKIKSGKGAVHVIQNAHEDWITCMDASEKLIVTGSADNNVRVWKRKRSSKDDQKSGEVKRSADGAILEDSSHAKHTLTGHDSAIFYVKYLKECELIVSCDTSGCVKCWRLPPSIPTGGAVATAGSNEKKEKKEGGCSLLSTNKFPCLSLSSLSTIVCTLSLTTQSDEQAGAEQSETQIGEIADWAAEVEKDEELTAQNKKLIPSSSSQQPLGSKYNAQLLIGHENGHVTVVDPLLGTQISTLVGHSDVVNCAIEQKNDTSIFSGSSDASLIKWTAKHLDDKSGVDVNRSCDVEISAVDLYNYNSFLRVVLGDVAGCLHVLEYSSGKRLTVGLSKFHSGVVSSVSVAHVAGKMYLLSAGRDGKVINFELTETPNGSFGHIIALSVLSTINLESPIIQLRKVLGTVGRRSMVVASCWDSSVSVLDRNPSRPTEVLKAWTTASPSLHDEDWKTDWLVVRDANSVLWNLNGALEMKDCFINKLSTYFQTPDRRNGMRLFVKHEKASSQCSCFELDSTRARFYIGDSRGFVHTFSPKEFTSSNQAQNKFTIPKNNTVKTHSGSVRCIRVAHGLLLTSGDDCEMRVWRPHPLIDNTLVSIGQDPILQQVAQFSCHGPVTCLSVHFKVEEEELIGSHSVIAAADKLGYLYSLKLPID